MSSDKDIILGRLNAMAQIVTAHLATTKVETDQLPEFVRRLYASLSEDQPVANTTGVAASRKASDAPLPPEKTEPSVTVDEALAEATSPTVLTVEKKQQPAVPIKESVFPDYIICLEDGKQLKSLKRHLTAAFGMTIEDYKTKWGLPDEYPTVAPNYTEMRRQVAQKIGLGKRASQNDDTTDRADASAPSAPGKQSPTRNKAKAGPKERSARKGDEHRLANAFSR
ncbi:Ros/MucR family transcriptional regulator [Acetobacter estunensis NRIC 0472]|uniref:MucR family transcriptional regulator n=1 Tax=Acetobacteraceae TaxID=433 RepID=UPI002156D7BC|nr:Ros/MucR family transcriptional regulator [Acetobacter estunensis NRIC 0472]